MKNVGGRTERWPTVVRFPRSLVWLGVSLTFRVNVDQLI
jgi:hypothetical protein